MLVSSKFRVPVLVVRRTWYFFYMPHLHGRCFAALECAETNQLSQLPRVFRVTLLRFFSVI